MTPEYLTPIRITWIVPDETEAVLAALERFTEGRVLFVEAEVGSGSAHVLGTVLSGRKNLPFRVSLIGPPETLQEFVEACPKSVRFDAVVMPPHDDEAAMRALAGKFRSLTLGLWSTPEGVLGLGRALAASKKVFAWGITVLNPHAPAENLNETDRALFVSVWKEKTTAEAPKAIIHDLFLSSDLGLDPWKNYAGCQAGDSLAHVGPDGLLRACRTLAVILGDLNQTGLREIWSGEARKSFLKALSKIPEACGPCARLEICKGGCPGLAGPSGRDRSCPGTV